ncbi:hypothetical protein BKA67DRAFT_542510 [Truncatella angustata]|uniref:Uncharacterized protein n=1 Tax=Truncatella angustata TaxID=152316 RepID=A0A9P8UB76_9PEZI|nr:uncharacterized protein BKA67DRAFT_542510 [Truncatella angustata]KAH6639980.1 hypothetical protein BKA67DRAFT_542510 [Truncatella angustata]
MGLKLRETELSFKTKFNSSSFLRGRRRLYTAKLEDWGLQKDKTKKLIPNDGPPAPGDHFAEQDSSAAIDVQGITVEGSKRRSSMNEVSNRSSGNSTRQVSRNKKERRPNMRMWAKLMLAGRK